MYDPSKPIEGLYSNALELSPEQVEVIAKYPIYHSFLGIKYFFQSVVEIFIFISILLFFSTMSLMLKQIYEEKEIEVGIWRTLGAGGVRIDRD